MLVGAVMLIPLTTTTARADVIYFKDGYFIEGQTVREGERVFEKNESIWIPKGFYFVFDGARNTYFSPVQVQDTAKKENRVEGEIYRTTPSLYTSQVLPIPPVGEILEATPWDDHWQRKITIQTLGEKGNAPIRINLTQQITTLSTRFAWVNTKGLSRYMWPAYYMTSELGPEVVRKLLHAHLKMDKNAKPEDLPVRRGRIVSFLMVAGWYEDAQKELDELLAEFPDQKEKFTGDQDQLRRLKARRAFDDVKRAMSAGQHALAQKQLADLPEDMLDDKPQTEAREWKGQYEAAKTNLDLARRLLAELPRTIKNSDLRKFFTETAAAIQNDLGFEEFMPPLREADKARVGRLETFLTIAKQAETQRKAGDKEVPGSRERDVARRFRLDAGQRVRRGQGRSRPETLAGAAARSGLPEFARIPGKTEAPSGVRAGRFGVEHSGRGNGAAYRHAAASRAG